MVITHIGAIKDVTENSYEKRELIIPKIDRSSLIWYYTIVNELLLQLIDSTLQRSRSHPASLWAQLSQRNSFPRKGNLSRMENSGWNRINPYTLSISWKLHISPLRNLWHESLLNSMIRPPWSIQKPEKPSLKLLENRSTKLLSRYQCMSISRVKSEPIFQRWLRKDMNLSNCSIYPRNQSTAHKLASN